MVKVPTLPNDIWINIINIEMDRQREIKAILKARTNHEVLFEKVMEEHYNVVEYQDVDCGCGEIDDGYAIVLPRQVYDGVRLARLWALASAGQGWL
jgi:hypothetical protein